MKIAIISDIHDNVWKLKTILNALYDADLLICSGDLCSPFIVDLMAQYFSKKIHIVFGNNDGDLFRITQNAAKHKDATGNSRVLLHGQFYSATFDNKKIAVNHYPDIAIPVAQSGAYNLVCYGHNHLIKRDMIGSTLFINPGTVMGYDPIGKQDIPSTFAVYDTMDEGIKFYKVEVNENEQGETVEYLPA